MGVTSLWELLNRAGKKCELSELAGKRLAIDSSVWLVQFVKGMRAEDGGPLEGAHVRGLFTRVLKLLYYGIRPVFVFDGDKPPIKAATLEARAIARRKMESKARVTARELLIAKVKRRLLKLVDVEGKSLTESELRSLLSSVDVGGGIDEGQPSQSDPLEIVVDESRAPVLNQRVLDMLEAKEKFDEELAQYEDVAEQLPPSESGLMFSNMQIANLMDSLRFSVRPDKSGPLTITKKVIQSEPGKQMMLIKGGFDGVIPKEVIPKQVYEAKESLLKCDDDIILDGAEENLGDDVEFESEGEVKSVAVSAPEPSLKKAKIVIDLPKEKPDVVLADVEIDFKSGPVVDSNDKKLEDMATALVDGALDEIWIEDEAPKQKRAKDQVAKVEEDSDSGSCSSEVDERLKWKCPFCTWVNRLTSKKCEMCDGAFSAVGAAQFSAEQSKSMQPAATIITTTTAKPATDSQPLGASYSSRIRRGGEEPVSSAPPPVALSAGNESTRGAGFFGALEAAAQNEENELRRATNNQIRMLEGVDMEMIEECKDLLRMFGIPWESAPMEAEAQCAYLNMHGLVDGVVTEDSDVFLVGSSNVYKNLFRSGSHPQNYVMSDVATTLGLNRMHLVQLAYFLGSDYTVGVKGVGLVLAMEILSEFKDETSNSQDMVEQCVFPLLQFRSWFNNKEDKRFAGLRKKLQRIHSLPSSFPDEAIARAYLQPVVNESKEQFQWIGRPDWKALETFAMNKLHWTEDRCRDVLGPIQERLEELEKAGKITQKTMLEYFSAQVKDIPIQVNSNRLEKALKRLKGEKAVKSKASRAKKKAKKNEEDEELLQEDDRVEPKEDERKDTIVKPRTAYAWFVADVSPKLKEENPDMSFAEISRTCAAQWRLLEDRDIYYTKAAEDKVRFAREQEKQVALMPEKTRPEEEDLEPPFDKERLAKMKMNRLRWLCHKYGLKPSVRKEDVIAQLAMLTKNHKQVPEAQLQKVLIKSGSWKQQRQEDELEFDRFLEKSKTI